MATDLAGRRLGILAVVAVALFSMLGGRLYFLQVMQPEEFEQIVASNRVREIFTEAPRGQILDTKGRVLAGRRESLVVTLDWTALREAGEDTRTEIFSFLADELSDAGIKTKASRLLRTYNGAVDGTLKPVVVADDIGPELWVRLSEEYLPGVGVERQWVRTYPYGSIGAHMLGYTSQVHDTERADELNASSEKTYFAGDQLGIAGLERSYEDVLRGTPELRRVEVDAQNRVVRTLEVVQEAVPGQDLVLSLDIDLQYAAEQILADELRQARDRKSSDDSPPHVADSGSLVALDVNDGSVIALASYPAFDPRDFIFGISSSLWTELSERSDLPLLDRTVRGNYPIGSTFKPVTAYAALESGIRDQFLTWNDEGSYTLTSCIDPENQEAGCVFRNAGSAVLGPVQMREAIERSSDTYFYAVGEEAWINQDVFGRTVIQDVALRMGLGVVPGIDLPSQEAGRVPTPENRIEEFGEDRKWFPGDNVNLAIGQGDLLLTPLQLANAYAMLATGGTRYAPRLVDSIIDGAGNTETLEPVIASDDRLDPAFLAPIYDGMLAVVNPGLGTGRGTATSAFSGFPLQDFPILGKTGTAEVARKADFSLFASFGPWPNPQYSVVAILEQAGFGGDAAAPAVRRFYELLAGLQPVPPAPFAEERVIDVVGITEIDLTLPTPEVPAAVNDPTPELDTPATSAETSPPATARPSTTSRPATTTTQATTVTTPATTQPTTATTAPTTAATTATTVAPTTSAPPTSAPTTSAPTSTGGG